MKTACSTTSDALNAAVRRSLLLAGFLLGCGLVALVSAGSAHADEQDRSSRSSEARGGSNSGGGLLGGLLEPVAPVVSSVAGVTDPVLSGASRLVAPVVEPVIGAVEPVTAPLLAPVTESLAPVVEVLAPVTEPLLRPAEPVVTPVARGLGVEPQALGITPASTQPSPVEAAPGAGATVAVEPPRSSPSSTTAASVDVTGPLRAVREVSTAMSGAVTSEVGPRRLQWPSGGPEAPRQDVAVLAGTTGAASSGGNAGGSPGQADLPGHQAPGTRDGGRVVVAERWLIRPWCFVLGRHHPS